ncbi:MAG: hypothetical protein AAFV45_15025 [Pseudomonadota bacterium]
MTKEKPSTVEVEVAPKPWVMEQLMDTERRIEKAFHEQTQYLSQQQTTANAKIDQAIRDMNAQTKWIIGLFIALIAAIIVQPLIG